VNGGAPTSQVWRGSEAVDAALYPGDALDFLTSLPDDGAIDFRIADSFGRDHDAVFRLSGVARVRKLIARACGRAL
jgi:hypothetical protein